MNSSSGSVSRVEEKVLKVKAIPIMVRHKRIWHPSTSSSSSYSQSCCGGAEKFSFGHAHEEVSQTGGMLLPSLTSWPKRKRLLHPPPLQVMMVVVMFFLFLSLEIVGGSEDWTGQCPSGCKCTWVSGKKWAECKGWTAIPAGLSPEVQVLDMSGSTMKTLPKDAFKSVGLVNLQKVFLQRCRIERIDRDAFRDLSIMIELDLSDNLVSSIDMEAFDSNVRLRELKLSKNTKLTKLTGLSFPHLGYLKLLDLSDCQLSTLPRKAFERLNVLETLSLSGNRFTFLSKEILKPLTKLKSLSLAGNPWKCDCRLKSLRDWVMQSERNLLQHHTKCAEPAHVANFPWDQLVSPDFACRPEIVSVQINGKPTDALLVHTDIGSDITLECLVRGNPPPDLKWVRDAQVLTNSTRSYGKPYYLHIGEETWDFDDPADAEYRGRWVNLTILKTDPEDAGEYTCVGSNAGGVVEKNLTLNFQDVPSGAGVGHGVGGFGGGPQDQGWIWIVIGAITILALLTVVISLVCLCSRRRRVKTTRAQDLKSDGKLNGSIAGYIECPNLASTSTSTKTMMTDGGSSGQKSPTTTCRNDDHQPQQRQLLLTQTSRNGDKVDEEMLIMKDKPSDYRSKSTDMLSSPYNNGTEMDSYNRPMSAQPPAPPHPDLLDLPHNTRFQESPAPSTVSTLPDSTRMLITPQQLNPIIVNPSRLGYNQHPIYSSGLPFPGSQFSPSEPAIVPAARSGYVTLPRRNRVPSWSPGPSNLDQTSPPSPTGSAATISFPFIKAIKYDNLGPRTTADGSSRLSLNNLPEHSSTPNHTPKSFHHAPYHLIGGTLGRHNVLRSSNPPTPSSLPISHFAPIQEVEVTSPTSNEDNNVFAGEQNNSLPRLSEETSKTESSPSKKGSSSPTKKVPPKPPPKPGKKMGDAAAAESNGKITASEPAAAIANDDGTEV